MLDRQISQTINDKHDPLSTSTEFFQYMVIYEGGTYVRLTPDVNGEKTGDIIQCGTILLVSKSIFIDGVNYVKLLDESGWVFVRKGDVQILELIDYRRNPPQQNDLSSSPVPTAVQNAIKHRNNIKASPSVSNKAKYWKKVRIDCSQIHTFLEYLEFVRDLCGSRIPSTTEAGPARSEWMANSTKEDAIIRSLVSRISSIVIRNAFSDIVGEVQGLEAALWIFVHLGVHASHVIELGDMDVNLYFSSLSKNRREMSLEATSHITELTRDLIGALSGHVGVLGDDMRQFIQRWVLLKVVEIYSKEVEVEEGTNGSTTFDQDADEKLNTTSNLMSNMEEGGGEPAAVMSRFEVKTPSTPRKCSFLQQSCLCQYFPSLSSSGNSSQSLNQSAYGDDYEGGYLSLKKKVYPSKPKSYISRMINAVSEAINDPNALEAHIV